MASANKMCRLKYSCEEIYERMDKGLCIFCEELDTPGHNDLKHKGIKIFMTECYDDQVYEDKEEAHLETVTNPNPSVETVTNLEPFVEPMKSSGPFIESLKHASVLQVPGSVSDVFLVHRVDSHVKEVEELPQESTNGNEKNVAHQVFDEMPLALTSKEKQRKSLKAWKFKFKISFKRSKLMDDMFSFVEETAWLNRDPKETIWDYDKKEFKKTMAACGKKITDRFKLVYDGTVQIRVWDCGGSLLKCVDESYCDGKSSEEAVTVLEACPQLLNTFFCIFDNNKLDNSRVCNDRQKGAVCDAENNKLLNIEVGAKKGKNSFMNPQPLHDKRITRALLVGLVGTEEKLSDRLSLANYVWKPGELLGVQDQWGWISEVHSGDGVMKITQWLRGMRLQGLINMDKKLQKLLLDDVLRVVCWSVHNKTFEAELEIYISYRCLVIKNFSWFKKLHVMSLQENSEMVLSLAKETQDWIINSWLKSQVSSGFDLKAWIGLEIYSWKYKKQHKLEKSPFQRTYATQLRRCGETLRQICFFTDQMSKSRVLAKQMLVKENDIELDNVETGEFFSSAHGGATVPQREMKLQQASEELLESPLLQKEKSIDLTKQIIIWIIFKELCSAGYAWENETIKESFKELSKHEKDHKLLFPKHQKLLNPEATFCTQYNDLEQLNTEHQSSPCLDYFTYLDFIWEQVLNCGCEAGLISSGSFSVGDVNEFFICSDLQNGDETHGKRLLDWNEISLLDNDVKVNLTIKVNWFYKAPMIRGVFHLQRPPELINLQGTPNFITKVLVQWKEHPPDQFFSSFYWQVLMLSSLRTRMF